MIASEYAFHTEWFVPAATPGDVARVLEDIAGLPRWWPQVYLAVRIVEPGDEHAVGCVADLETRGLLPYRLRWRLHVVSGAFARTSVVEASGDLDGRGVWNMCERDGGTCVTYDWHVRARKPLLRRWSPVLRPLFAANHRWAMRTGERSLRREVARRKALLLG